MWSWILVGVLYALGVGFFRLLGGVAAAGDAMRRWVIRRGRVVTETTPSRTTLLGEPVTFAP